MTPMSDVAQTVRAFPVSVKGVLIRDGQGFNPLQVIAAKDGYQPVAKLARIIKGSSVTLNFSLNKS
jgi:hypothetical protein